MKRRKFLKLYQHIISLGLLSLQNGMMGALQTDDGYTGHGYGSLVTKCLSKKIAEMGFDVNVEISENNTPSRSLFSKLGFKFVEKVGWIITKGKQRTEDK